MDSCINNTIRGQDHYDQIDNREHETPRVIITLITQFSVAATDSISCLSKLSSGQVMAGVASCTSIYVDVACASLLAPDCLDHIRWSQKVHRHIAVLDLL